MRLTAFQIDLEPRGGWVKVLVLYPLHRLLLQFRWTEYARIMAATSFSRRAHFLA
jgi:hypothetical protein